MIDEEKNPWQTRSAEVKYENPWIKVEEHQVLNPSGNPGIYGTVHYKHLAIGIIPLDEENNTWLVGQYRYPLKKYSWEIVEGGGKHDVDPLRSAQRELLEETGIIAKHWEMICEFNTSNSVTDEVAYIYVARGLEFTTPIPDENEELQVKKIPFAEAVRRVMQNEIMDSLSIVGILKLKNLLEL